MPRLIIVDQWLRSIEGHHSEYDLAVAQAAIRKGFDICILSNSRYRQEKSGKIKFLPTFTATFGEPYRHDYDHVFRFGATPEIWPFYNDLTYALTMLNASAEDHLFIHSIEFNEIEDLLRLAVTSRVGKLPQMHILLRRDPDEITADKARWKGFVYAVRTLSQIGPQHPSVKFYTDTSLLTAHYATKTGVEFQTVPVPFRHDLMVQTKLERKDKTIQLAYLGDARAEKGFNLLPGLVRHCFRNPELPGVRFKIQGNFNTPGGEMGISSSRNQLETFPPEFCKVYRKGLSEQEYYSVLSESDIVLLPYDVGRYKSRSSGVFYQAKTAGKSVVTPCGSQMASLLSPESAEVYNQQIGFVSTVENLIKNLDQIRLKNSFDSQYWLNATSADILIETLLEDNHKSHLLPNRKTILYLCEAIPFWERSGSGFIVARQLKYFREAGYRVICVGFVGRVLRSTYDVHEAYNNFAKALDENGLDVFFKCISYMAQDTTYSWTTLEGEVSRTQHFSVPADLKAILNIFLPDVVYFNYIFRKSFVEKLGLGTSAMICEVHDLQSAQYALARNNELDLIELATEIEMLADLDAIVSLSTIETARIESAIQSVFVRTIPPAIELPLLSWGSLAGPKDLAELLSSCSSRLDSVDFESAWSSNNTNQMFDLFKENNLDLLFVGAHTIPNIAGLKWFCENVLPKVTQHRKVTIVIAGSLEQRRGDFSHHANIFWAGPVAELSPLYSAAKIVILPIVDGAGINIKVTESLSYGKPVVATSFALRGIPAEFGLRGYDDPNEFAKELLALLDSQDARRANSIRNREIASELSLVFSARKLMNEVMIHALGAEAPIANEIFEKEYGYKFLEWSSVVPSINRVLSAFLEADANLPFEIEKLYNHLIHNPDTIEIVKQFIEALFINKSAPILKTSQPRFVKIANISTESLLSWQNVLREIYISAFRSYSTNRSIVGNLALKHVLYIDLDQEPQQKFNDRISVISSSHEYTLFTVTDSNISPIMIKIEDIHVFINNYKPACFVVRSNLVNRHYDPVIFAALLTILESSIPVIMSSNLSWITSVYSPLIHIGDNDENLLNIFCTVLTKLNFEMKKIDTEKTSS